jgi:hypothetical protein
MAFSSEFLVRSFDFVAVIRQGHFFVDGSLSDVSQLANVPRGLNPALILTSLRHD